MENAYAESLIGNWFLSLGDARELIEAWRKDYDSARPYSSLGGLPPEESMDTTERLRGHHTAGGRRPGLAGW